MVEKGHGKREGEDEVEESQTHVKKQRLDGLESLQEVLRNTKLAELEHKRQHIVQLEHSSTIGHALKVGFELFITSLTMSGCLQRGWWPCPLCATYVPFHCVETYARGLEGLPKRPRMGEGPCE